MESIGLSGEIWAPNLGAKAYVFPAKKWYKRLACSHVSHSVICLHNGSYQRHRVQKQSLPGQEDETDCEVQRGQDEECQQEVFLGCEGVSEDC